MLSLENSRKEYLLSKNKIFDDASFILFSLEIPLKAVNQPYERCRLMVFFRSKYNLAQELIELSRRYFFNLPGVALLLKNVFRPFFLFSSRNPRFFIGVGIFGYHGDVKSFAPLIGRTISAHCRSAFWLVSCVFHKNFNRPFYFG